jgi:predicted ATPase
MLVGRELVDVKRIGWADKEAQIPLRLYDRVAGFWERIAYRCRRADYFQNGRCTTICRRSDQNRARRRSEQQGRGCKRVNVDSGGAGHVAQLPDGTLDQLPSAKTVAQVSAAIGREFAFDLLEAVVSLPHGDVRKAIDRLQEAGLIFRRKQSAIEMYMFKHALVQDTAYASMLRSERQPLHARIAKTLATKFIDVAEGAPEIIAYHYTQAREVRPAIQYWLKAGQEASKRSAFMEAITHFQSALKLLEELPEDKERFELEIQIQQSFAAASMAAKGFGAEETMLALNRALKLCHSLNAPPQIFPVLSGLVGAHLMRGEIESARELAQDLLNLARNRNDQTALLMGHRILGMSLFTLGDLSATKRELQSAIEIPAQHAPEALIFSQDFKSTAQAYLGLTSVLLGDTAGGLAHSRDALAYAEQLRHPHSVSYVLSFLAGAYLVAGNAHAAFPVAERTSPIPMNMAFRSGRRGADVARVGACRSRRS